MASIDSLDTLLVQQLRDLYDAEKRLTKAIPKLAKASSHDDLREALEMHLGETQEQVSRLEQAFEQLGVPAKAKPCAGMRGLIEEGEEHVKEDYEEDGLRDAAIIGSAQRVEHYEIAAYGTAIAHARLLDHSEVVQLLEESLAEEKAADEKLTEIAESVVNLDAASEGEESESDEEGEDTPTARRRGNGAQSQRAGSRSGGRSRAASGSGASRSGSSRSGMRAR
jgi:ferritin-like metal-binding protein YciE